MTTYTVAVGRSWHDTDGTPAPDDTCGHRHHTADAAAACGTRLYGSRYVRGSWTANARWHDWYIVDNDSGHKIQSA